MFFVVPLQFFRQGIYGYTKHSIQSLNEFTLGLVIPAKPEPYFRVANLKLQHPNTYLSSPAPYQSYPSQNSGPSDRFFRTWKVFQIATSQENSIPNPPNPIPNSYNSAFPLSHFLAFSLSHFPVFSFLPTFAPLFIHSFYHSLI
jgi:hypothetical protein